MREFYRVKTPKGFVDVDFKNHQLAKEHKKFFELLHNKKGSCKIVKVTEIEGVV